VKLDVLNLFKIFLITMQWKYKRVVEQRKEGNKLKKTVFSTIRKSLYEPFPTRLKNG